MNNTVEQLKLMVMEINAIDGEMDNLEFFEMDELNEMLEGVKPQEVLRMAHFGYFNWADDYFNINVYGNLDSINEWELTDMLTDHQDEIEQKYNELVESGDIEA